MGFMILFEISVFGLAYMALPYSSLASSQSYLSIISYDSIQILTYLSLGKSWYDLYNATDDFSKKDYHSLSNSNPYTTIIKIYINMDITILFINKFYYLISLF